MNAKPSPTLSSTVTPDESQNKSLTGTLSSNWLYSGEGIDVIRRLTGSDDIHGSNGDDLLLGGPGDDRLLAYAGSDTLLGASGDDQLWSGDGSDWLVADKGSDLLIAGTGNDWLAGDADDDILHGDDGDDFLSGGNGNDILSGGTGANIVDGGKGNDLIDAEGQNIISGGDGTDRYRVSDFHAAIDGPDIFRDFETGYGGDILDLAWAIETVDPRNNEPYPWLLDPVHPFTSGLLRVVASGSDTLVQVDLAWIGKGQGYGTIMRLMNVAPEQLTAYNFKPSHDPFGRSQNGVGTNQNDTMAGSLEGDRLSGLGGDDEISGGEGKDQIDGGRGNDTLFGGEYADSIYGGPGDDHIYGDPDFWGGDHWSPRPKPGGADYIDGGDGNDSFYDWRADGGANTMIGGAGDDTFYYVSSMPDWSGYEYWPVEGIDRLTGGEGRDVYKLGYVGNSPADVVTDFTVGPAGDVIDLLALINTLPDYIPGTNPFVTGHLVLEQSATSTLLKALTSDYFGIQLKTALTLENTRATDLTPDNFVPPHDPSGVFAAVSGTAGADILQEASYPEPVDGGDGDDRIMKEPGGDVVDVSDTMRLLADQAEDTNSFFEAEILRLTTSGEDTPLELFLPKNFEWML